MGFASIIPEQEEDGYKRYLLEFESLRDFEDEKEKRLYNILFREVTDIFVQDLWRHGANETKRGFIDGLMDHCSECHKQTYYSDHVINSIKSQAKLSVITPLFYSALRKEIKTNKKVLF